MLGSTIQMPVSSSGSSPQQEYHWIAVHGWTQPQQLKEKNCLTHATSKLHIPSSLELVLTKTVSQQGPSFLQLGVA